MTLPARAEATATWCCDVAVGMKERAAIGGGDQLGAAFAAAVGIVSAHRLVLAIGPVPLLILVALVAGDDDDGADARRAADGVEQMDGAEHVDRVGLHRALVGEAHQRLRGHVDDDLGREVAHGGFQRGQVANVPANGLELAVQVEQAIEARLGRRIERVAADLGSHREQPEGEPTALEAGVPGKENLAGFPEVRVHI